MQLQNIVLKTKAIAVLDLVKIIVKNIIHLSKNYILIYIDNKKVNRNMNNKLKK